MVNLMGHQLNEFRQRHVQLLPEPCRYWITVSIRPVFVYQSVATPLVRLQLRLEDVPDPIPGHGSPQTHEYRYRYRFG